MVDLVQILASVTASVAASLGVVEYRFRRKDSRESSREIEQWYSEAAQLGRSIQTSWRNKFERPNSENGVVDFEEVQSDMNLFSSQLSNHASEAASLDVSDDVVEALEDTAQVCREVYEIRVHMNCRPDFEEKGEEVMSEASHLEELALSKI